MRDTKKLINGFTRQEVMSLTGITSGKLTYWDETGLVAPDKIGNPKRPTVIYSWQQLLQLRLIDSLRSKLSLQEIRKVLTFLEERNYSPSLFDCKLVFIESELYLIEDWKEFGTFVLKASGRNKGKLINQELDPIKTVLQGLRENSINNHVIVFDKRIEKTPLGSLC